MPSKIPSKFMRDSLSEDLMYLTPSQELILTPPANSKRKKMRLPASWSLRSVGASLRSSSLASECCLPEEGPASPSKDETESMLRDDENDARAIALDTVAFRMLKQTLRKQGSVTNARLKINLHSLVRDGKEAMEARYQTEHDEVVGTNARSQHEVHVLPRL